MTIELTPEQTQLLQGRPEGPVAVIDPASRREYVLVSREEYEKGRQVWPAEPPLRQAGRFPPPPAPQRLADLPTPPEVTEEARRRYAERSWWDRHNVCDFENTLKLHYYYGGHLICYLLTKQGAQILIVHQGDDEEYHRQYRALTPTQRERAVVLSVPAWKDEVTELPAPHHNDESHH